MATSRIRAVTGVPSNNGAAAALRSSSGTATSPPSSPLGAASPPATGRPRLQRQPSMFRADLRLKGAARCHLSSLLVRNRHGSTSCNTRPIPRWHELVKESRGRFSCDLCTDDDFLSEMSAPCVVASFLAETHWQAEEHGRLSHPMIETKPANGGTPTYKPYPVCATRLGYHRCCVSKRRKWCGGGTNSKDGSATKPSHQGELLKFGIGIALFFKFMKAMAVVFMWLSLLTLPALALYGHGSEWSSSSSLIEALWRLTPANFGESDSVCAAANNTDSEASVTLQCPPGTVIGQVDALYGENQGSCACPSDQAPTDGQCPANRRSRWGTCSPPDSYCFYGASRTMRWTNDNTYTLGPCCSSQLHNGEPDFRDLNPRAVSSCNAASAARIVQAMCLRRQSCELTVSPARPLVWRKESSGPRRCTNAEEERGRVWREEHPEEAEERFGEDVDLCAVEWASGGGFSGCDVSEAENGATRNEHLRLMAAARCVEFSVKWEGIFDIEKDTAATIIVVFDLAICASFLLALRVITKRERQDDRENHTTTASDYTVLIRHLPPHSSLETLDAALRHHFETLLSIAPPVSKELPHGVKVADINFGLASNRITELRVAHGKAADSLQRCVTEMAARGISWDELKASDDYRKLTVDGGGCLFRMCGGVCRCCVSERMKLAHRVETLRAKLASLSAAIRKESGSEESSTAVQAFVTFEEEEGAARAKMEFPDSKLYAMCCAPRLARMRLSGGPGDRRARSFAIRVERAMEPSDILWENCRYATGWEGSVRRIIALIAFLCLVTLGGSAIFAIEAQKLEIGRAYPDVDCASMENVDDKVAAIRTENLGQSQGTGQQVGRMECFCRDLWRQNRGNVRVLYDEPFPRPPPGDLDPAEVATVLNSTIARVVTNLPSKDVPLPLPEGWSVEYPCGDWFTDYLSLLFYTYGGAAMVVVIAGVILPYFVKQVVSAEKLLSKSEELVSRARNLFYLQFMVTAIVVLIVNTSTEASVVRLVAHGDHSDFTTAWFSSVGVAITLTMMFNVALGQVPSIRRVLRKRFIRWHDRHYKCSNKNNDLTRCRTQQELDDVRSGPKMPLEELYAIMVNTIAVCITFSTGLPLLLPIACGFLVIFFWVQKFMLFRMYRTPPQIDLSLSQKMGAVLPFAVVAHLLIGAWIMSNPTIFQGELTFTGSDGTEESLAGKVSSTVQDRTTSFVEWFGRWNVGGERVSDRIGRPHGLALAAPGLILAIILIVRATIWEAVSRCGSMIFSACPTNEWCDTEQEETRDLRSYFDALPDAVLNNFELQRRLPKVALRDKYAAALKRRRREDASLATVRSHLSQVRERIAEIESRISHERALMSQSWSEPNGSVAASPSHLGSTHDPREAVRGLTRQLHGLMEEAAQLEAIARAKSEAARSTPTHVRAQQILLGDGFHVENPLSPTELAQQERSTKIMTGLHSYDIDDNLEYQLLFGFDIGETLSDRSLREAMKPIMPQRDLVESVDDRTDRATLTRARTYLQMGMRSDLESATFTSVIPQLVPDSPRAEFGQRPAKSSDPGPGAGFTGVGPPSTPGSGAVTPRGRAGRGGIARSVNGTHRRSGGPRGRA